MPRTARLDLPGLLQHVIVRGINRSEIFKDDQDRQRFIQNLSLLLLNTQTECFAWALMPNHVHLLLCPRQHSLAHFMRRLLTGYAIYFNCRHKRSGHLFQNRYKSMVCEEDRYLLALVRYIHLNPLRGGLVNGLDALEHYPWCGHAGLVGQLILAGQMVDKVLLLFSERREEARRIYREFMADGVKIGRHDKYAGEPAVVDDRHFDGKNDQRILGGDEFCQELERRVTLTKRIDTWLSIAEIVERVCQHYDVKVDVITQRSKPSRIATVRSVICYLAVRVVGHKGVDVGVHVGLRRAAVSQAIVRGEAIVSNDRNLLKLTNK